MCIESATTRGIPLSPINRLREATASLHQTLDEQTNIASITSDRPSLVAYLLRFHRALLRSWSHINWGTLAQLGLPDLTRRLARYQDLPKDIAYLSGKEPGGLEQLSNEEPKASLAHSIGSLYVLEGSIHGGRIIIRSAEKQMSDLDLARLPFLTGFGSENGVLWQRFCKWTESINFSETEIREACETAITVFSIFKNTLSSPSS